MAEPRAVQRSAPRPPASRCCGRYLVEGQAVLVFRLVPAPQVQAVERAGQGQVLDDLHGAGWENAADAVGLAQVPVLIQLPEQHDGVPLVEAQLPGVVPAVGVQSPGSGHLGEQETAPAVCPTQTEFPKSINGKKMQRSKA